MTRWSWLLLVGLLAGCSSARHKASTDVIRHIGFDGNGQGISPPDSSYRLRQVMQTKTSSFGVVWPGLSLFVEPKTLDRGRLAADAYALEVWYAHHGWFDARFDGFEVRQVRRQTKRLARVVDIIGHVTPGERSTVRDLTFVFGDRVNGRFEPIPDAKARSVYRVPIKKAKSESGIAEKSGFDLDIANAARDSMLEALRRSGHAYAAVELGMEAFPDAHAVDVRIESVPGISCRIGEVTVEGNEAVPTEIILDETGLLDRKRRKYSIEDLREAQKKLFDLQMFSVVTVTPDLSDPTRVDVPIHIKVTESKPQTVRIGGGLDYTGLVVTPRVRASYTNSNLLGELVRFEAKGDVGYAYTIGRVGGGTPVYGLSLSLAQARLFGQKKLGGSIKASIEQDVQNGQFAYFNPQADIGVSYRLNKKLVFTAGPHFEQYRYLDLNQAALIARSTFGEGFQNPYTLTAFDFGATWDSRRPGPIDSTTGWYHQLQLRQAIPFGAGDFLYGELQLDSRTFLRTGKYKKGKVAKNLVPDVVAVRGMVDYLLPYGDRALPYPERVFLGGANDVRGFWDGQVGPYDCLCLYRAGKKGDAFTGKPGEGQDLQKFYAPEGGAEGAVLAVEPRWMKGNYGFALFGNVATLGEGLGDVFDPKRLRFGYGLGARYKSAVGPIRLDLAFRPLYPEDAGPNGFVNCLVRDQVPRSFDIGSLPPSMRDLSRRKVPFAITVYFAIGQAI